MREKSRIPQSRLHGGIRSSRQKRKTSTIAGGPDSAIRTSKGPHQGRKAVLKENISQKTGPKGWKEIPIGGMILEAGNAAKYETGSWRTYRPVRDQEKCINCLLCWIYCPDSAVLVKDGKIVGIDYEHCKGCGICARECPSKVKAIKMVKE